MRWEALFADMEGQVDAANTADLLAGVPDLTRAERATVTLAGRLRAAGSAEVVLRVRSGELVSGSVVDVADQWVLLGDEVRRALVPSASVVGARGLERASSPEVGVVGRRLGLGHALRALARDRAAVRVVTIGGELAGRLDRVGSDHVDLVAVADGPRSAGTSPTTWAVPFAAIDVVHSG
ncbi:hypothetical protein [Cellulomonas aerilata]|nr:hypothetical protein [Cellulomonas aerilata]